MKRRLQRPLAPGPSAARPEDRRQLRHANSSRASRSRTATTSPCHPQRVLWPIAQTRNGKETFHRVGRRSMRHRSLVPPNRTGKRENCGGFAEPPSCHDRRRRRLAKFGDEHQSRVQVVSQRAATPAFESHRWPDLRHLADGGTRRFFQRPGRLYTIPVSIRKRYNSCRVRTWRFSWLMLTPAR